MSAITPNSSSYGASANLQQISQVLLKLSEKLSSGKLINQASDSPAGAVASEYLRASLNDLNQSAANTSRANDYLNVADSALSQTQSLVGDLQSLSVQAANTGALGTGELQALQMQTDSTLASINRIMSSTTFGSKNVFDSQSQIPVSNVSSQLSSVSLNAFAGDKSRAISVQLASAADGSLTATVDGQAATLSGNRLSFSTSTLSGEATLAAGTGAGTYSFTASPGGMNFAIGTSGQSVSFAFGQMDTTALGLDTLATGGANSLSSNPENAMSLAGAATETIARAQGRLGAFQQSTLETNLNSLQVGAENLASAGSSISDTDYASATLQQTQALILQKASIATQSQANLSAANVLSLLS